MYGSYHKLHAGIYAGRAAKLQGEMDFNFVLRSVITGFPSHVRKTSELSLLMIC